MIPAKPSHTARRTATYRAHHQHDSPRVFEDPFAEAILGDEILAPPSEAPAQQAAPRLFVALRARVAEDLLAQAVARGVRDYVVLGAGLDTFALRNPHAGLRVVEVDHPATQAWKRERLAKAGLAPPPSLTFLPVDFTTERLPERLLGVGVGPGRPAFFSWLGVTYYLPDDAISSTLQAILACGSGSEVVFDFYVPPETMPAPLRGRFDQVAARVEKVGEPFTTFFTPDQLERRLRGAGFREVTIHDRAALVQRYAPGLRSAGFGQVAHARV